MIAVAVELGALAFVHRVLDGQRVQAELVAEHREVLPVGVTQIQPDHDRLVLQVLADVGDGKALADKRPVPVEPGACLAFGRRCRADRGSGHRVGVAAMEGPRR